MMRVLVVRPSSLGDVVHALSLARDVRRAHPSAVIDWVAEEAFVDLPTICADVATTFPFALRRWRHAPLSRATWGEIGAFRRGLRAQRYDAILDLQEQLKGALVARAARGVRHGFDRASIREPAAALLDDVHHAVPIGLHFAQRCRRLAGAALGYEAQGRPRWTWRPLPATATTPKDRYAVLLHMTSRDAKLWPEDRWRALVARLVDAGLAVLLPWGSEAERARSGRLARDVPAAHVPPRQPIRTLASLLSHADLVVGVDTGLTHLAAALGTPTVALFTETDPAGAGVAMTGDHARDLGGNGRVPALDEVEAACGALMRATPRC